MIDERIIVDMTSIDPRVEQSWKEAHEKNDKRYRVLQESEGRIRIGESKTIHCKRYGRRREGYDILIDSLRCIRCARPLSFHTASNSTKIEWHPL